jgi:hypothetical protein
MCASISLVVKVRFCNPVSRVRFLLEALVTSKEYHRIYNRERYHRLRREYIELMGGKCVDCGTQDNLEFDHAIAATKSFDVGRLLNYSKTKRDQELAKCVLRCSECHKKKSVRMKDVNVVAHGEGLSGKRNCKCEPCRIRKAEYMREWWKNHRSPVDSINNHTPHSQELDVYECWQCLQHFNTAEDLIDHLNTDHRPVEDDLWRYAGTAPTQTV